MDFGTVSYKVEDRVATITMADIDGAGDTVVARATVTELVPKKCYAHLETSCSVGGRVVIEGEAILMVPSREGG